MSSVSTFSPERIRKARLEAGFSRTELSHRARTSEKNIARWEKGEHTPRLEHIAAIAEATGKDVAYFLASDDDEEGEAEPPLSANTMHAVTELVRALRREQVA